MIAKIAYSNYSPVLTTLLVLRGTSIAVIFLGTLLISYDGFVHSVWLEGRTWIVALIFSYLLIAELLLRRNHQQSVNYMLIFFYISIAFCTLLLWGLNAPIGILVISFAVILPSILMGTRSIMPVAVLSVIALVGVQLLHKDGIVSPNLQTLSLESTFWDVIAYSTILSIFALVSWIAGTQREKNLYRALSAESALSAQKDNLAVQLEKQSSELRLTQLNQIRHLHRFALLGQSTAATLHELSNHLSVLNLDIDDLGQQLSNSKAIENAKDGINHINKMVHEARQQLNSYDQRESFNALMIINRSIKDVSNKFKHQGVELEKHSLDGNTTFYITGSPLALMQIVAILLNNALDASKSNLNPKVILELRNTRSKLNISIIDNGPGINSSVAQSLFNPVTSKKSSGLGVGLYIAQHLAKDQFNGLIQLLPTKYGAHFMVTIPKNKTTTDSNTRSKPSHTHLQSHVIRSAASPSHSHSS